MQKKTKLEDIAIKLPRMKYMDFPGGPVVKTPCFHCRMKYTGRGWGAGGDASPKEQNIRMP